MAVDLIVIPRSFSSSLVSVNRTSPAFAEAIIPAFETSESVRVDFPWSTGMMRSTELRNADEIKRHDHTVGDNTHVTNVSRLVHQSPDLVCKVRR